MMAAAKKTPSLKFLTTKLKEIQNSFRDICRFVEDFQDDTTATQASVRLERIDDLWERFGDTLIEIKSHDSYTAADDAYEKERQEFSDQYYVAKSFLVDKVKELKAPSSLEQSVRTSDTSMHGGLDHVRLPQIKLQSFNGDIDQWLSFRDLFTSLIHLKMDLPEVEKFHYLKGCLQGEPKSLLDPLQITTANYTIAWDMLCKRYNNSKLLRKRQVQSLFKLPTLSKESVSELQTLLEGFERIVQTLDQVIQPAEYKDLLLVNLLTTRLDPTTRRGWEEFSSTRDKDVLTDLTEFLHRRIGVLESLPARVMDTKGGQQQTIPKQRQPIVRTSYSTVQPSDGRCIACKEHHLLYLCPRFQRLTVPQRNGLLWNHSRCRNCFRTGHRAKDCPSKYSCRHCKGRHHTLVCFQAEGTGGARVAAVPKSPKPPAANIPQDIGNPGPSQVANMAATDVVVSGATRQYTSQVLLATAVVIIEDDSGNSHLSRALLDSGSENNFISERLLQWMTTTRKRVDILVLGIGQAVTKVRHKIRAINQVHT